MPKRNSIPLPDEGEAREGTVTFLELRDVEGPHADFIFRGELLQALRGVGIPIGKKQPIV